MLTSLVPRPFPTRTFCACAVKRGGERKGSGESAYTATDPGRNAAVGVKYALVTTATGGCQSTSATIEVNAEGCCTVLQGGQWKLPLRQAAP